MAETEIKLLNGRRLCDTTARKQNDRVTDRLNLATIMYTTEGEEIILSDSSNDYFRGLKIFGDSYQYSTDGFQLFNPFVPYTNHTNADIQIIDDGKTIVVTGGGNTAYATTRYPLEVNKLAGQTVYLTAYSIKSIHGKESCILYALKNGEVVVSGSISSTSPKTNISIPADIDEAYLDICSNAHDTLLSEHDTVIIEELMIAYEESWYWERYTNGSSPNYEYPCEILNNAAVRETEGSVSRVQLFDISKVQTLADGTLINNGDGTLTVNVQTRIFVSSADKLSRLCPNLTIGDIYTLTAESTGITKYIYLTVAQKTINFGDKFVLTQEMYDSYIVYYASGENTTATISNIMVNKGATALPYEPYTDGNVKLHVYGSNLWEPIPVNETLNGVTLTYADGIYTLNGTCTESGVFSLGKVELFDGLYTLNANNPKNNGITKPLLKVYSNVSDVLYLKCTDDKNNSTDTFVLGTGIYERDLYIEAGITYNKYTIKPMLNFEMESLPYVPYKPRQKFTCTVKGGLDGLQTREKSLVTYVTTYGMKVCADYIDFEAGEIIKMFKRDKVNITYVGKFANGNVYGVCNLPDKVEIAYAGSMCDRASVTTSNFAEKVGCFYENTSNVVFVGDANDTLQTLQEKYNGAEIMYIRKEPLRIPLTPREIEAYKALHTNSPDTVLLNNISAHMKFDYTADNTLYIKKLISEFASQLVDRSTGKKFEIYVDNGTLMLKESEV